MFALNCFWVQLFCFYSLQEQRLFESGSRVCVNGLQRWGSQKYGSQQLLLHAGWERQACKNGTDRDPGMCRDYSGLPLPTGEEAAKQDMALPGSSLRSMPWLSECDWIYWSWCKTLMLPLYWSLIMVWCSKSLPVLWQLLLSNNRGVRGAA